MLDVLEELKGRLKPRGERLVPPDPSEDVEFWKKLNAVIEAAQSSGIQLKMKDIADYLGVSYATLRNKYSKFKKLVEESPDLRFSIEDERRQIQQNVEFGKEVQKLAEGEELPSPVEIVRPQQLQRQQQQQQPQQQPSEPLPPISRHVETRVLSTVIQHLRKKVEDIAKESAELVLRIGGYFLANYAKWCYERGFDDLKQCIDTLVETYDRLKELEAVKGKFDFCQQALKKLVIEYVESKRPEYLLAQANRLLETLILVEDIAPDRIEEIIEKVGELVDLALEATKQKYG